MPCNSRAVFVAVLVTNIDDVLASQAQENVLKETFARLTGVALTSVTVRKTDAYISISAGSYSATIQNERITVSGPRGWNGTPVQQELAAVVKNLAIRGGQKRLVDALRKLGVVESDTLSANTGARVVRARLMVN